MIRRLKVLLLTLLIMVSGLTFTACHGSRGTLEFTVPSEFDKTKNYEISFWAKNDTNKAQADIYKKAIENFQAIYPNITVNLKLYTDYSRIYNDVITNISTGTTPNVCITYPDHIATYITGNNVVVPLNSLLTDEVFGLGGTGVDFDAPKVDEIVPEFLKECYIGDTCYALPYMRSTEALYINKTFVEALGYEIPEKITWDFIWEVSEKAMEKDADGNFKVNNQKVMIPFIYKSTDNMMIQMLNQLGAGYSDENGNIEIFNENTGNILYEIAEHAKSGAFSTFKISSYPANFLNAGQCIFAIDSTAGSTWMGCDAPLLDIAEDSIVRFETVVREIPQYDTENPKMISQGPSLCVFNKDDSGEVLASWLFTQYLLTNDIQTSYARTEGYAPVTVKAQNSEDYKAYLNASGTDNNEHYSVKIDATEILLENTENTFTTPVFNGSASLRQAAGELIENVVKSVRRKETIDSAYIQKVYKNVSSLYRLDQIETGSSQGGKSDLGPLPSTAVTLIVCLAAAWVLIILYFIFIKIKEHR
ncbi:MAG: extracellular solute-binding protein [Clostridia bacterium]|nr:extracellular solute-binding protein [Clostridia bacterium]